MPSEILRPALNAELAHVHQAMPKIDMGSKDQVDAYRQFLNSIFSLENAVRGKENVLAYEERDIPGPAGPMRTTIFRPKNPTRSVEETPGFFCMHGGGLVSGNRFVGVSNLLDWVETLGATLVTAEYRLAPEHPQPAALEDSYAALQWMSENSTELGFNPRKLIVAGGSAGGNLAAGVTLLARDRSGPGLLAQVLMYPLLDDSNQGLSVEQFGDIAPWMASNTVDAQRYALGENHENADMYTIPLRAKSLHGLPPTFIDVGEADPLRDQDVAYALNLWKAGVSAELHVWPGGWHGFDAFVPEAPISQRASATRLEWLRKLLESS
ncbi:alpha/beta hydrolase [Aspergillus alliaceus]|uniref:alpha/beta hydrolase n=1 Tax=Petromyces alliaceus TaxID=209559 RepID=UPI0012A3E816|nr:Alpha/Beta hydrolase protein [Aspergillus alliaceus]KAB8239330.1 Alpha/Beta hydrolase protein [Aspergillus alliaceus]